MKPWREKAVAGGWSESNTTDATSSVEEAVREIWSVGDEATFF